MPKEQDPMRTRKETGSIDDIGDAALDRVDELGVVLRIILEISILNDDDVSSRLSYSTAQPSLLPCRD